MHQARWIGVVAVAGALGVGCKQEPVDPGLQTDEGVDTDDTDLTKPGVKPGVEPDLIVLDSVPTSLSADCGTDWSVAPAALTPEGEGAKDAAMALSFVLDAQAEPATAGFTTGRANVYASTAGLAQLVVVRMAEAGAAEGLLAKADASGKDGVRRRSAVRERELWVLSTPPGLSASCVDGLWEELVGRVARPAGE